MRADACLVEHRCNYSSPPSARAAAIAGVRIYDRKPLYADCVTRTAIAVTIVVPLWWWQQQLRYSGGYAQCLSSIK